MYTNIKAIITLLPYNTSEQKRLLTVSGLLTDFVNSFFYT